MNAAVCRSTVSLRTSAPLQSEGDKSFALSRAVRTSWSHGSSLGLRASALRVRRSDDTAGCGRAQAVGCFVRKCGAAPDALGARDEVDERSGDLHDVVADEGVELDRSVNGYAEVERVRQFGELVPAQLAPAVLEVEREPLAPDSLVAFVLR